MFGYLLVMNFADRLDGVFRVFLICLEDLTSLFKYDGSNS